MSRLTSLPAGWRPDPKRLGPFNFRRLAGGPWLLTNDFGRHLFLEDDEFRRFVEGGVSDAEPLGKRLCEGGFVNDRLDFAALAKGWADRTAFQRNPGPVLHEFVVTLRCNLACRYCHSSVVDPSRTDTDMTLETAKKSVDFLFTTPNPVLGIEFQGGEPLLNWPVVKFVVRYARAKAAATGRTLTVSLVSNFSLLNDERLDFLLENYVSLCTSLDGPPEVHDRNRPLLGGGPSQKSVVAWLKRVQQRAAGKDGRGYYLPGALLTTTRHSFPYVKEIVSLYEELGMQGLFVRKLSPIGYAKRVWDEVGYAPEEFAAFYEEMLDEVIARSRAGSPLMERWALVCLSKILANRDPGYMDLRSPTGAVLGCLAYNYDGRLFSSDEGRMVDHTGDATFEVGTVDGTWEDVLDHPTTRALVHASTLENQPMCSQCAYKPWCGLEPVYNYETQGTVFGRVPESGWCRTYMAVFDVLMGKLRDPGSRAVLEAWLERDARRGQGGL